MRKRALFLVVMLTVALGLLPPDTSRAQEGRLHIVASFSILADVARNVAGDAAEVTSLMPLNADPHAFIPAPQDLVTLAEADVIFIVGANFEEGLAETIQNAGEDLHIVVASNCVEILPFGLTSAEAHEAVPTPAHDTEDAALAALCASHHAELAALWEPEEDAAGTDEGIEPLGMLYALDCGDGHEHADEASGGEEEGHEHEPESCDAHVWTDPHNVMLWALLIRDTLSDLDPAHAAVYAANAAAYVRELAALVEEVEAAIATIPEEHRRLVTNHLAFGYYANTFGLEMVGTVIPGASSLAEPSATEVAALIDAIRAEGVPAVFAETTTNPDLAEQIAAETGVHVYTLYTGSLSEPDGPAATYLEYLRQNTAIIVEALGAP